MISTSNEAEPGGSQVRDRARLENWPLIIGLSAVAVEAASLASLDPAIRGPLVLWFCLVCTGMAWVRLLRISDPVAEGVAAVALSIALSGLVSTATLYAGRWSPIGAMVILEGLTLIGVAIGAFVGRERNTQVREEV